MINKYIEELIKFKTIHVDQLELKIYHNQIYLVDYSLWLTFLEV